MNHSFETMKRIVGHSLGAVILLGITTAGSAWADDATLPPAPAEPPADEGARDVNENPDAVRTDAPNDGDLPVPASDNDPQPEVAMPGTPAGGLVEQAGVGGPTGYGRAGVLELGGSVGMQFATNLRQMNISPSIGWFVADNFQVSGIFDFANVSTDGNSATIFGGLAEPSYHLPFSRVVFGFLGLGVGASYVKSLGTGFAVAPRLGANLLVGRSGILSPALSWQYTTHDTSMDTNTTLIAVSSAVRFNIGYTVMW